jgi:hypothetical protein
MRIFSEPNLTEDRFHKSFTSYKENFELLFVVFQLSIIFNSSLFNFYSMITVFFENQGTDKSDNIPFDELEKPFQCIGILWKFHLDSSYEGTTVCTVL